MSNRIVNLLCFIMLLFLEVKAQKSDSKAIDLMNKVIDGFNDYYGKTISLEIVIRKNNSLNNIKNLAALKFYEDNVYLKSDNFKVFSGNNTPIYFGSFELFSANDTVYYFVNHSQREVYVYRENDIENYFPLINYFSLRKLFKNYKSKYICQWDIRKKQKQGYIRFVKLIPKKKEYLEYMLIGILEKSNKINTFINVFEEYQMDIEITKIDNDDSPKSDFYFNINRFEDYYVNEIIN